MRKLLSYVLTLSMLLSLVPTPALAEAIEEVDVVSPGVEQAPTEEEVGASETDGAPVVVEEGAPAEALDEDDSDSDTVDENNPDTDVVSEEDQSPEVVGEDVEQEVVEGAEGAVDAVESADAQELSSDEGEDGVVAVEDATEEGRKLGAQATEATAWFVDYATDERTATLHTSRTYQVTNADGPVANSEITIMAIGSTSERFDTSVTLTTDDDGLIRGLYYRAEEVALPSGNYGVALLSGGSMISCFDDITVVCDGLFTGFYEVYDWRPPTFSVQAYKSGYSDERYDGVWDESADSWGVQPTAQLSSVDLSQTLRLRFDYASEMDIKGSDDISLESIALVRSDMTDEEFAALDGSSDTTAWPSRLDFDDMSKQTVVWERGDTNLGERFVESMPEDSEGSVIIDQVSFPQAGVASGVYFPLVRMTIVDEPYVFAYRPIKIAEATNTQRVDPRIVTTSLADATQGKGYTATLKARPGTTESTLSWTIAEGALPEGLTIDPANGTISGTPTTAGTYSFGISLTEEKDGDSRSARQDFTLVVQSGVTLGEMNYTRKALWPVKSASSGTPDIYRVRVKVPVSVDLKAGGYAKSQPKIRANYTRADGTKSDGTWYEGSLEIGPHSIAGTVDLPADVKSVESIELELSLRDDSGNAIMAGEQAVVLSARVDNPELTFGGWATFNFGSFDAGDAINNARIRIWSYDGTTKPSGKVRTRTIWWDDSTTLTLEPGDYVFTVEGQVDVRENSQLVGTSWVDIMGGSDAATPLGGTLPKQYTFHVDPGQTSEVDVSFTAASMDYHTVSVLFKDENGDYIADLEEYDVSWYRRPEGVTDTSQDVLVGTGNTVALEESGNESLYVQVFPKNDGALIWHKSQRVAVPADQTTFAIRLTRKTTFDVTLTLVTADSSADRTGIVEVRRPLLTDEDGNPISYESETKWVYNETATIKNVTPGTILTYTPSFSSLCASSDSVVVADGVTSYTLTAPYAKGIVTFEKLSLVRADDESTERDDDVAGRTSTVILGSSSANVEVYKHGTTKKVSFYQTKGTGKDDSRVLIRDEGAIAGASYDIVVRCDDGYYGAQFANDYYAAEKRFEVTLAGDVASAVVPAEEGVLTSRGRVKLPYENPTLTEFELHLFAGEGDGATWVDSASRLGYRDYLETPFLDEGAYMLYIVEKGLLKGDRGSYATLGDMKTAVDNANKPEGKTAADVAKAVALQVESNKVKTASKVTLPAGLGLTTPIDRVNCSVSATKDYTDKLSIHIRTALNSGVGKPNDSSYIELVTNQPSGQSGEGYMNPRALVVNSKAVKLSRWSNSTEGNNPFNQTQNMVDGSLRIYPARTGVSEATNYPQDIQLVIPRRNTTSIDVTAWLVSGGQRYFIGNYFEKTQDITLTTPPRSAWQSFSAYGNTAPDAVVSLYIDGMRAATAYADEYGFYTANLSLPNEGINDGDSFQVSAVATWQTDEGDLVATSQPKIVRYDSTAPAVERLTVCYQRDPGGEYNSFVAWERGDLKSKYLSFYRAENEDKNPDADHAKFFWLVELANADKAENVYINVPRSDGVMYIETTKSQATARAWIPDVQRAYARLASTLEPLTRSLSASGEIRTTIRWGGAGQAVLQALMNGNAYVSKPTYFSYAPTGAYVTFDTIRDPYEVGYVLDPTRPDGYKKYAGFKDARFTAMGADATQAVKAILMQLSSGQNRHIRLIHDASNGVITPYAADELDARVQELMEAPAGCIDEWFALGGGKDEHDAISWMPVHHTTVTTDNVGIGEAQAAIDATLRVHASYKRAKIWDEVPTYRDQKVLASTRSDEMGYASWVYYVSTTDGAGNDRVEMMYKHAIGSTGKLLYTQIAVDRNSYTRTDWNEETGQRKVIRYEIPEPWANSGIDDEAVSIGDLVVIWGCMLDTLQQGIYEAERRDIPNATEPTTVNMEGLFESNKGLSAQNDATDKFKSWAWGKVMYGDTPSLSAKESRLLKNFLDKNSGTQLQWEAGFASDHYLGGAWNNAQFACAHPWLKTLGELTIDVTATAIEGPNKTLEFGWEIIKESTFGGEDDDPWSDALEEHLLKLYTIDQHKKADAPGKINTDWSDVPDDLMERIKQRYAERQAEAEQAAAEANGVNDPSGFVYEAVLSNRVQGATVTLYTYNAAARRAQFLDSKKFGVEENPQVTGKDGRYQWFVPEGYWQVRVSKAGYESRSTGESDAYGIDATKTLVLNEGTAQEQTMNADSYWMPVLPVQLDVNIPLVSLKAPVVEKFEPDEEGVTITFSKYVKDADVTAELFTLNGETPASVKAMDSEKAGDQSLWENPETPLMLARTYRLTYAEGAGPTPAASAVTLSFDGASGKVKSYADVATAENFEGAVALSIPKKANTLAVSAVKTTQNFTYKSAAQTLAASSAFKVTGAKGAVTYAKKSGNANIKIASNGTITLAKGLAPGSYAVVFTVKAAGNDTYKAASKDVKITFKVDKAAQTITAADKSVAMGKTVSLGAKTSGGGKLTYTSADAKIAKVSATGVVTPVKAGKVKITIKAATTTNYKAASKTIVVTVVPGTQTITASNKKCVAKKTVKLGAKTSGDGKLTYKSSNTGIATVSTKGVVTGKKAGTVKITITAAKTSNWKKATKTISVKVVKAKNPMKASAKKATVNVAYSKVKSAKKVLATNVTVAKAQGKVTYSNASTNATAKKFKVAAKTGKLTIPKKTKKGKYQVILKVKAAGNSSYLSVTKTVKYYVKVK